MAVLAVKRARVLSPFRGVPVVVLCIEDSNDGVDLGAACHDDIVQA